MYFKTSTENTEQSISREQKKVDFNWKSGGKLPIKMEIKSSLAA